MVFGGKGTVNKSKYYVSKEELSKYKIITEDLGKYQSILGDEPGTGRPIIVLDYRLSDEERQRNIYELIHDIDTNEFTEEELIEFDKHRDSKYDKLIEKICCMSGIQDLRNLSEAVKLIREGIMVLNGGIE